MYTSEFLDNVTLDNFNNINFFCNEFMVLPVHLWFILGYYGGLSGLEMAGVYFIGIKDTFECFMMVLNYRAAVLKPRRLKG